MGCGNVCTHNECEGLYYLDKDFLDVYRRVEKCGCGQVEGFDYNEEAMNARELGNAGISYDLDGRRTGWGWDEWGSRQGYKDGLRFDLTAKLPRKLLAD